MFRFLWLDQVCTDALYTQTFKTHRHWPWCSGAGNSALGNLALLSVIKTYRKFAKYYSNYLFIPASLYMEQIFVNLIYIIWKQKYYEQQIVSNGICIKACVNEKPELSLILSMLYCTRPGTWKFVGWIWYITILVPITAEVTVLAARSIIIFQI